MKCKKVRQKKENRVHNKILEMDTEARMVRSGRPKGKAKFVRTRSTIGESGKEGNGEKTRSEGLQRNANLKRKLKRFLRNWTIIDSNKCEIHFRFGKSIKANENKRN